CGRKHSAFQSALQSRLECWSLSDQFPVPSKKANIEARAASCVERVRAARPGRNSKSRMLKPEKVGCLCTASGTIPDKSESPWPVTARPKGQPLGDNSSSPSDDTKPRVSPEMA